jgi:hypothetical protein
MNMPDASNFILVFEALLHHVMQKRIASIPPSRDPLDLGTAATTGASFRNLPPVGANTVSRPDAPSDPVGGITMFQQEGTTGPQLPWLTYDAQPSLEFDMSATIPDGFSTSMPDETLTWAFLQNDTIWNMEAGLGRYVYGEPIMDIDMLNGFQFNL